MTRKPPPERLIEEGSGMIAEGIVRHLKQIDDPAAAARLVGAIIEELAKVHAWLLTEAKRKGQEQ